MYLPKNSHTGKHFKGISFTNTKVLLNEQSEIVLDLKHLRAPRKLDGKILQIVV